MELSTWRLKLLDIGKKNRLINYKDNRLSSAEILEPDLEKAFKYITSGQKIGIIPLDKIKEDKEKVFDQNRLLDEAKRVLRAKQFILSSLDNETSKTLVNLNRKAKNFIIDKGINVLYLTFAMLNWESKDLKEHFTSPLIMVPVKLYPKTALENFMMEQYEDEVIVNPTLKYKIFEEYKVEIPEYVEDSSIIDYLISVENVVNKLGWTVNKKMKLGLFSFLKMNMYVDLKDNEKLIMRNPHILNLLNKGTLPSNNPISDSIVLHNVVDADSSQIEAIKNAYVGNSFVLQGPPGTGKSQTITNIIAEALMAGKKVLFVSEKIAALNIVYSNLCKVNLGDFCLELHSFKANKKDVIEQFYNTMTIPPKTISEKAKNELQKLSEYQDELNKYAGLLQQKEDVIEMTPYEIFNELGRLHDYPILPFNIQDINHYSKETFEKCLELIDSYISYTKDIGYDYHQNPWFGFIEPKMNYTLKNQIATKLWSVINCFREAQSINDEIVTLFSISINSLNELTKIDDEFAFILNCPVPFICGFDEKELLENKKRICKWATTAKEINTLKESLEIMFDKTIYSLDGIKLADEFTNKYKNFFRGFSKQYRMYKSLIIASAKKKRLSYIQMVQYLKLLASIQEKTNAFNEKTALYLKKNEIRELPLSINWNELEQQITRVLNITKLGFNFQQLNKLIEEDKFFREINLLHENIKAIKDKHFNDLVDIQKLFNEKNITLKTCLIKENITYISNCIQHFDELDSWCLFLTLQEKLVKTNVLPFIDLCIEKQMEINDFHPIYEKCYYDAWAHYLIDNNSTFKTMGRNAHDRIVEKFIEKDQLQFDISQAQIIDKLSNERPNIDLMVPGSQGSILAREHQKKRNFMSVRLLLNSINELAQTLKPCFLMSPLSVSTYLDPNFLRFDLVIFDEASQIFPWDAIGAIYRSKQIIVVGDSMQLPPTNFFNATSGEASEEEIENIEDNVNDYESILDLCSVKYMKRRLKWHYRSRSEQLIAFSNENYYNNELVTFPSANDCLPNYGISYHFVEKGIFDRLSKTNIEEANKVVSLVLDHFKNNPHMSLGVVTFNQSQQELIEHLLDQLRGENPFINTFLDSNEFESFFVKNLETVQGDERDVIIFSIGYAKDKDGKFLHNFGPLNRSGGERRLNVAITRAKCKMIIVSSIDYTDIDLTKTESKGAMLLKAYLQYAKEHNEIELTHNEDFTNNEFTLLVYLALKEEGYQVIANVGCSAYKIDIVVKDPHTHKDIVAIECDGYNYQNSKETRDRDRLRKMVLTRMGFAYYRVWSSDWINNPTGELKKLKNFIDQSLDTKTDLNQITNVTIKEEAAKEFMSEKIANHIFDVYSMFDMDKAFKTFKNTNSFSRFIKPIIEKEAPIAIDYLLKRIITIYDRSKVTSVVKNKFNEDLKSIMDDDWFIYRGFIYTTQLPIYPLRLQETGSNKRDITEIATEELAGGMFEIIKQNKSVLKEGLFKTLADTIGFNRVTEKNEYHFQKALETLVKLNYVKIEDDMVYLKK